MVIADVCAEMQHAGNRILWCLPGWPPARHSGKAARVASPPKHPRNRSERELSLRLRLQGKIALKNSLAIAAALALKVP